MKITIDLEIDGDKVVLAQVRRVRGKNVEATVKAGEFLQKSLQDGPKMAAEVFLDAELAKISRYSVYTASRALGVIKRPVGYRACDGWVWELPNK